MERMPEQNNSQRSWETTPREVSRRFNNLYLLLGKLVNSGPELDPIVRRDLQRYLAQFFGTLGISKSEELLDVRQELNIAWEVETIPTPPGYPTLREFAEGLRRVQDSERTMDRVRMPNVPVSPTATDLSQYARHEWSGILDKYKQDGRRGQSADQREKEGNMLGYLYDLGKVMTSPYAYEAMFPREDAITVDQAWQVGNGIQRALVLRTLGPEFVSQSGMDRWVTVKRTR